MRKGLFLLADLAGALLVAAIAVSFFGFPRWFLWALPVAAISVRIGPAALGKSRDLPKLARAAHAALDRLARLLARVGAQCGRLVVAAAKWAVSTAAKGRPLVPFLLELGTVAAIVVLAKSFCPNLRMDWGPPWSREQIAIATWIAAGLCAAAFLRRALVRADPRGAWVEAVRIVILGAIAIHLMSGLERATLHGAGDASWYAFTLADATSQFRAGVFPLWCGQTIFQFNGAICPQRVAPAFDYLGGLIDLATLRALGPFALQNLLLTLVGIVALYSAYLCAAVLLPARRWLAAGLAVLFLSCPGVLGLAYNTDLFMSWMTVPLIPVVWFATVRSFEDGGSPRTLALLGGALGLCWWGHAPIALWSTLLAGAAQAIRLLARRRVGAGRWLGVFAGCAFFAGIAAYPIGSVLLFPPGATGPTQDLAGEAPVVTLVYFLGDVFPGMFLPLSAAGRVLSDFQLGYALWFLFVLSAANLATARNAAVAVSVGAAAFLTLLLLPIPGFDSELWLALPRFLRNTTGTWPMSRLYLPIAGSLSIGTAAMAASLPSGARWRRRFLYAGVALGCAWSVKEAGKFAAGSRRHVPAPESAVDMVRPENVAIARFSYFFFPRTPDFFTHGVTDPAMENRLYARSGFAALGGNMEAASESGTEVSSAGFIPEPKMGPNVLRADRPTILEPGARYLLVFDELDAKRAHGVLQISGQTLHREYELPESGGARAFGAGGRHSNALPISTSAAVSESLVVRFVHEPASDPLSAVVPFSRLRLVRYDPSRLPVRVDSWIPYRATVTSPAPAWLETPRMYQAGYRAAVDGLPAEISKSPQGLVAIAVPSGSSTIELAYRAPAGLQALFWLSVAGMAGTAVAALRAVFRSDLRHSQKPVAMGRTATLLEPRP